MCKRKLSLDFKPRELRAWTPSWTRRELSAWRPGSQRANVGDFGIPAVLPSRHPIVERLILSIMWSYVTLGTRALEPLARDVLDFKRSEEHTEYSVEVFHMQKTWHKAHHRTSASFTWAAIEGCCCIRNYGCCHGGSTLFERWPQGVDMFVHLRGIPGYSFRIGLVVVNWFIYSEFPKVCGSTWEAGDCLQRPLD